MGTNLLRYALWRGHGTLPIAALITGADNPSARTFALREHFHAIYYGERNKTAAIEALCGAHNLSSEQLVCVFDDVNDLGMSFGCGIRVLVRRSASPLLHDYVTRQHLCDYVTAHAPERHAVREVCELLLGLARLVRCGRRVTRRVGSRLRGVLRRAPGRCHELIDAAQPQARGQGGT